MQKVTIWPSQQNKNQQDTSYRKVWIKKMMMMIQITNQHQVMLIKTKPSKHTKKFKQMFGELENESLWINIHKKRQRIKRVL